MIGLSLSPNLGLSESLSERLIQNVKWPCSVQRGDVTSYTDVYEATMIVSLPTSDDADHDVQTTSRLVHVTLLTVGDSTNFGNSTEYTRCHMTTRQRL